MNAMKKVFTTMLLSMFCYCAFAQLSIWYNGKVVYTREYAEIDSITFGLSGTTSTPTTPPDGSVYTPEQTKNKLMDVAERMVKTFNTDDQKAVINLAENLYVKFKDYSWDETGDYFENRYTELWEKPRNMIRMAQGRRMPVATNYGYTFSFAGEAAIFEADETNQKWVYKGKSNDKSMILRCKDSNGNTVEAKFWSEGTETTYKYTWEDYHWDAPKKYADEEGVTLSVHGYYNGSYYNLRQDETGGWYYTQEVWDEQAYEYVDKKFYVNLAEVEIEDAYGYKQVGENDWDSYYYNYEATTGRFYRKDWSNEYKVYDGTTRTVTAVLPAKTFFTLKQGNTELIRFETQQEFVKNNHADVSVQCKLANLNWTMDANLKSKSFNFAFTFNYGTKKFFSGVANLPSIELIDKQDNQTFEDWAKQYEDRYEELLKKIGPAEGIFDLFGEVQVKVNTSNFGYAARDFMDWDKNGDNFRTKKSTQQFCDIFNLNATNGIYYGNDTKQAELRVIVSYDERYDEYEPEPVLYFPADGSSYGFQQYFDRKPFTSDLKYMVEDLVNDYIRCSKSLYDEVGTVSF